jgi:hypothetical protein
VEESIGDWGKFYKQLDANINPMRTFISRITAILSCGVRRAIEWTLKETCSSIP